jgi:hypothetical protein
VVIRWLDVQIIKPDPTSSIPSIGGEQAGFEREQRQRVAAA